MDLALTGAIVIGCLGMIGWAGRNDEFGKSQAHNVTMTVLFGVGLAAVLVIVLWVASGT